MTKNLDLARECGATPFTPPPLRAVRGVSFAFDQLEAFAARALAEAVASAEPAPGVQSEALRLAAIAEVGGVQKPTAELIAAELRRQHAHIAEIEGQHNELVDAVCSLENKVAKLEAQLEAIGAGGVSVLMPARPAMTVPVTDADVIQAFEAWATHPDRGGKLPIEKHKNGAYTDSRTYSAWFGWKSCAARLAGRVERKPLSKSDAQYQVEFMNAGTPRRKQGKA